MSGYGKAALLVLGLVLPGRAQAMESLEGQWEKKVGKTTITLTFASGRMHAVVTGSDSFKLHADCQVTRDGLVYGLITSAEIDGVEEKEEKEETDVVDQAFCFRARIDEGMLIVRHFKSTCKALEDEGVFLGQFKSVHQTPAQVTACSSPVGANPAPRPTPAANSNCCSPPPAPPPPPPGSLNPPPHP